MSSPARSPSEPFDVALVALSARALARSARRGGLSALTVDLFADADTREHAAKAVRVPARAAGFERRALTDALATYAPEGLPIVFGAGLEHDPALMTEIGERWPIAGAAPETVRRLKDPASFAALLQETGVPHPRISLSGQAPPGRWLSKRIGASGGAHIRPARRVRRMRRRYLQEWSEGRPVSALFLSDGTRVRLIGFSEQWADPAARAPFRFGGAVGPVDLPKGLRDTIAQALDAVSAATGLIGLASADMLLADDGFRLLEINPRPGATIDVFDRAPTPSLLKLHLDACAGALPAALPLLHSAQATAVVYARVDCRPGLSPRPHWTADWPACDEVILAGSPVCTTLATGPTPTAARTLVLERRAALLESLESRDAPASPRKPMVSA